MPKKIKYGTIFCGRTNVFLERTKVKPMADHNKYYVGTETQKLDTVQEAVDAVGISRSSFYKYKDDIFPFKEKTKGENITFILQMDDEPGLLSAVLAAIAQFHGNILTIHQSIPMNGVAGLTLSVAILPTEGDAAAMVDNIEHIKGVHYLKILGRE